MKRFSTSYGKGTYPYRAIYTSAIVVYLVVKSKVFRLTSQCCRAHAFEPECTSSSVWGDQSYSRWVERERGSETQYLNRESLHYCCMGSLWTIVILTRNIMVAVL